MEQDPSSEASSHTANQEITRHCSLTWARSENISEQSSRAITGSNELNSLQVPILQLTPPPTNTHKHHEPVYLHG
jgi:hypothetical protein